MAAPKYPEGMVECPECKGAGCFECDKKGFLPCEHPEFDHSLCMECGYDQSGDLIDQEMLRRDG